MEHNHGGLADDFPFHLGDFLVPCWSSRVYDHRTAGRNHLLQSFCYRVKIKFELKLPIVQDFMAKKMVKLFGGLFLLSWNLRT